SSIWCTRSIIKALSILVVFSVGKLPLGTYLPPSASNRFKYVFPQIADVVRFNFSAIIDLLTPWLYNSTKRLYFRSRSILICLSPIFVTPIYFYPWVILINPHKIVIRGHHVL